MSKKTEIYCPYCEDVKDHEMINTRTGQCLTCLAKNDTPAF